MSNKIELLTTREAAKFLGIGYSTLCRLRSQNKGPKYLMLTDKGSIRYNKDDLLRYMLGRAIKREKEKNPCPTK